MKTRFSPLLAAVLAVSLLAAACGSDDDAEPAASEPAASETDAATEEPAEPGTIVEVATEAGGFTTLVAAVDAAGLVDTLNSEGPFTVFAPTDEAFAAALEALGLTAEELLADTDLLTSVLTYHVLPLEAPAETVLTLDGETVATVNGAEVLVTVDGGSVKVDEANVVTTDITASNGIIHVIDSVLLPAG